MKRIFFPAEPHSWLQFPVTLKGDTGVRDPHLTLKFFGAAAIDLYSVERRLGAHVHEALNEKLTEFVWEPKFWSSPFDHTNYYVLAFTKYPPVLEFLHNMFDVIKDTYIPWTPHITVSKEYFLLVEDQGFTPIECELKFEPVEICLGGPNL